VGGAGVHAAAQTAGVDVTVIVAAEADHTIGASHQFVSLVARVVATVAASQLKMVVPEVLVNHRNDGALVTTMAIKEV